MHQAVKRLGVLVLAGLIAACTAEVEDSGSLPEVDVRGGEMPTIDINPVDVNITTDTQVVVVPNIEIQERD